MKYEIYHQYPIFPAVGIGTEGVDTFTISPDLTAGNINRVKSVYIDLPADVILDIVLGPGQDNIHSNGNEAGSIIFRDGVEFKEDIIITVTGTPETPYTIRMVTEIEKPEAIMVAGVPTWLAAGLLAGLLYMAVTRKPMVQTR